MTKPITEMLPSELIRAGLEDVETIERTPGYEVTMSQWHTPFGDVCRVCVAGAVMTRRLDVRGNEFSSPESFAGPIKNRLIALDYFRCGNVQKGLLRCEVSQPADVPDLVPVPVYSCDRDGFFIDMRNMADMLEAHGL